MRVFAFLAVVLSSVVLDGRRCDAGIIGRWGFETSSFLDSSGFGHHFTENGSVTLTSGVTGNAAVFDGSSFLSSSAAGVTSSLTSFTVGAWIRSSQTQGEDAIILGKHFSAPRFRGGITLHDNDHLYGYVAQGSNHVNTQSVSGFDINDGEWHHVAQTFDGTTIRLYVDGVDLASGPSAFPATDVANIFSVGGRTGFDNTFVGAIDEAFLADHAMTQAEIQAFVPEPSSFALLGLSGLCMVLRRRRNA